ncbi:MAG: type II secretion system protein [Myxococcota bacterium]|nr:type II secretion system protein [Myxococcota bacterium]
MRNSNGFTLLEVLAAVAFVGLVFTALSRSATVGIISEGDNRRRMEAAMLADATMTAIEAGLKTLQLPPEGITEEEVDEFLIVTEMAPWDPPAEWIEIAKEAAPNGTRLFGEKAGDPGMLREITVRVEWFDGVEDKFIERVTLAAEVNPAASGLGSGLLPAGGLPVPGQ